MRRLWPLVLLVPALVVAQTIPEPADGQITHATVNLTETDGFIDLAECLSSTATITLRWAPSYVTSTATFDFSSVQSYWLYASNKSTTGDCPTQNGDKGDTTLLARQVNPTLKRSSEGTNFADPMQWEFLTADIAVAALGTTACSTTTDTTIHLCVQARASETANGTNVGTARGSLVLSTALPAAPESVSAQPGEQAARVSWSEGSGGAADSVSYVIEATPIGTITTERKLSPRVTASPYRLTGLVNDVGYEIRVRAYSAASNPGPLSADPAFVVTPSHVLDFWDSYRELGGRETGGCAGGPAGPAALLAAAAALALVRRKK